MDGRVHQYNADYDLLMKGLLWVIGTTLGGWFGWWLGSMVGITTAVVLSGIFSGVGLYAVRRLAQEYLE